MVRNLVLVARVGSDDVNCGPWKKEKKKCFALRAAQKGMRKGCTGRAS